MEFNNGKNIFIGINKTGDLVNLELNFNDLNKGTKFYKPEFYFSFHGFSDIKDSETGEQEARERLEDEDYWAELGYLSQDTKNYNPVLNHIDFKGLADEVLINDGWTNTNGEFYFLGNYGDKEYYINLQWCGFEKENSKIADYKQMFISKEDFKYLMDNSRTHQKSKKIVEEIKKIFSKYQDTNKIIKAFLEEKEQI